MAQTDAFKKYLDAGMAFTQLTRDRAEQVVKDLVAAGELKGGQRKGAIEDLVERSRRNAEALAEQVRGEVDSHLAGLGLARQSDVQRLEAELAALRLLVAGADVGQAVPASAEPVVPKPVAKKATKTAKAAGVAKAAPVASASGAREATPAKKSARKRA